MEGDADYNIDDNNKAIHISDPFWFFFILLPTTDSHSSAAIVFNIRRNNI